MVSSFRKNENWKDTKGWNGMHAIQKESQEGQEWDGVKSEQDSSPILKECINRWMIF
jgi:hypothetical protein